MQHQFTSSQLDNLEKNLANRNKLAEIKSLGQVLTLDLPADIYLGGIFTFLSASNLLMIKSVSHTYKLLSYAYIKQTESQIFYAVPDYLSSQVEVGTENINKQNDFFNFFILM